jgi:hypothetical protein
VFFWHDKTPVSIGSCLRYLETKVDCASCLSTEATDRESQPQSAHLRVYVDCHLLMVKVLYSDK